MTPLHRRILVVPAMALAAMVIALALPQAPLLQPPGVMDTTSMAPAIRLTLAPAQSQPAEPAVTAEPQTEATPQPPQPDPVPPEPVVRTPEPAAAKPETVAIEPASSVPEPALSAADPQPPVPDPSTPVAATTATTEVQPAPTAVPLNSGQSTATDTYLSQLMRHLGRHFVYPRRAQRLGQEGTPVVRFSFDRSGTLVDWRLEEGSGYNLLDQAALDLLKAAAPLPAIPDDMSGTRFSFTLPVRFHLR
ncbi:TonB family protein [Marinobacter mobilis]|uniref:Protein TonB n=1 Tax=Marinobacter mobilis TaxID=488533 RepID=A0A1H3C7U7_9GAMM|nr:TonB family protein [Marinobacter mobilis]SDX50166.1 protein TonB [Marinobacter mobilis]